MQNEFASIHGATPFSEVNASSSLLSNATNNAHTPPGG